MLFRGSIVALITPMQVDGSVDANALNRLVDWHIAEGTDAIVAMGTTGESATVTTEEQLSVIAMVVKRVAGRIPVIAGTGSPSTSKSVQLTAKAAALGVDATLCVTPYYVRPTQEGMFEHFKAVAAASPLPLMLYNVPSRTGCDLLPETVARLAQVPGIVGIKEATGNLSRLADIQARVPKSFLLLSGDDETAAEFMLRGGQGVISVTANVAPKMMAVMCVAAEKGQRELAEQLNGKLQGLHKTLFLEPNPTPAKWACAQLHHFNDTLRLPLLPLTTTHQAPVRAAMQMAGVL